MSTWSKSVFENKMNAANVAAIHDMYVVVSADNVGFFSAKTYYIQSLIK